MMGTSDKNILSIIIPVYNEEKFIECVINSVAKVDLSEFSLEKEIIIVDDCSTDNTYNKINCIKMEYGIKLTRHAVNKGKGAAIRSGLEQATGSIILIQDADMEYDPEEYPKLLKPIYEDKADVVFGSRFISSEPKRVLYFWHSVGNKFLTLVSNMLSNINLTDMETGYKVITTKILRQLNLCENRFGFEPEITAKLSKLAKKGICRIYEVGISYNGRTYMEGKKINWKDGVSAFRCILKYNLFFS